jgi:hypothetical protein
MFTEDLTAFMQQAGFAVTATVGGVDVSIILDSPGVEVLDTDVVTTEPSMLLPASTSVAHGATVVLDASNLGATLAHLAGTYRTLDQHLEPPDGAFRRVMLQRTSA